MRSMSDTRRTVEVSVQLPAEAADIDGRPAGELSTALRLLWIVDRVRVGRISAGKGAELAGMDR